MIVSATIACFSCLKKNDYFIAVENMYNNMNFFFFAVSHRDTAAADDAHVETDGISAELRGKFGIRI